MKTVYLFPIIVALFLMAGACDNVKVAEAPAIEHPVYVLNVYQPSISVIDGDRDALVRHVELPDVTSTFHVNPDGNLVLAVTGFGDTFAPYIKEIHVITPDGSRVQRKFKTRYIPDDMYLSADGRLGLVVHNTIQQGMVFPLSLIDIKERKTIKIFETHGFTKGALDEGDSFLFYSGGWLIGQQNGIYRIDIKDLTLTKLSDLSRYYRSALFKEGKLYGLSQNDSTLQVIDIKANNTEHVLQLPEHPFAMAFVEDMLYITHRTSLTPLSDNRVSIINTNTYEVEDIIEVGDGPAAICYSKSLGKVYTANSAGVVGKSVSVIDTKTRKVIKTIPINQRASFVVRCPQ